jgi:hypothetical protein
MPRNIIADAEEAGGTNCGTEWKKRGTNTGNEGQEFGEEAM